MPKKYDFLYQKPSKISSNEYHHKDNIISTVSDIIKKYKKYSEVLVAAEMQSGKTDVMRRLIYVINKHNDSIKNFGVNIDRNNIYVILCASSINLKTQLKNKLPEIKHHIYHLNDISRFIKDTHENESLFTMMADSGLVIFDESHCDVEVNKTIDKFRKILHKTAKHNKTSFYKLMTSATPYEQIVANYATVIMQPGPGYYGIKQMFACYKKNHSNDLPILFQAKNIDIKTECEDLFHELVVCNFYYIFRLPSKKSAAESSMLNIEKEFKKRGAGIDTYIYDMDYKENINVLLDEKPKKPTVIYLKDKLRMGEHLNTKYVFMVHDSPTTTFTHTATQSLIGRCCGYNKKSHGTIIYCDIEKTYQHYKWIVHDYDLEHLPSDAKYIKKKSGELKNNCLF